MQKFFWGVIGGAILSAYCLHQSINSINQVIKQVLTFAVFAFIISFIIYEVLTRFWHLLQHITTFKNQNSTTDWNCLLIDGKWGSGKTNYYQKKYKNKHKEPDIYISCFSATHSELIAQIINEQFFYKLITLNGILSKLVECNWRKFMPRNRVVVFDDLERLHKNETNYLDLIGIIDYLKTSNKCRIILICNVSESDKIFNLYMERIVDEVINPPLLKITELEFKNILDINNPITNKVIKHLQQEYESNQFTNLRIIKNVIEKLNPKVKTSNDNYKNIILSEFYSDYLIQKIRTHYLFFANYKLFQLACTFIIQTTKTSIKNNIITTEDDLENKQILIDNKKNKDGINTQLAKFGLSLNDWGNGYFALDNAQALNVELEPTQCILYTFQNLSKFIFDKKIFFKQLNENINKIIEYVESPQDKYELDQFIFSFDHQLNKPLPDSVKKWKDYILNNNNFIIKAINETTTWLPTKYKGIIFYDNIINLTAIAIIFQKFNIQTGVDKIIPIIIHNKQPNLHTNEVHKDLYYHILRYYIIWFIDSNSNYVSIKKDIADTYFQFQKSIDNYITNKLKNEF